MKITGNIKRGELCLQYIGFSEFSFIFGLVGIKLQLDIVKNEKRIIFGIWGEFTI